MMKNNQRLNEISLTARVLGALFYFAPDSTQTVPLVEEMIQGDWYAQWPIHDAQLADIARQLASTPQHPESLTDAWQRLFIGPWVLPAPPWGSVWLDHENVMFGDSMLQLRQWLQQQCIDCHIDDTEPCDHIGSLLLLVAWLAQEGKPDLLEQLLAWHLLPWAWRFLQVFTDKASHPFYIALGRLTQITLQQWQSTLLIPVAQKKLFL